MATNMHVAIVTGRSVADGRRIVPLNGLGVIGNHGFEVLGENGEVISEPAAPAQQPSALVPSHAGAVAVEVPDIRHPGGETSASS